MKPAPRHTSHITCLFLVFTLIAGYVSAQVISPSTTLHEGYNEKYAVLTDRYIYIAGEDLYFTVFNLSDREIQKATRSRVYYFELLGNDGSFITGAKFHMLSDGTAGYISIPENTATGNYLLRSYTRWMRNFPPSGFAFNRIKIINPYLRGTDKMTAGNPAGSVSLISTDTSAVLKMPVSCNTDKLIYGHREKVMVSLEVPAFMKTASNRYCITVTRPGAIDTINSGSVMNHEKSTEDEYPLQFIPETEGLSVSGKIVYKNNAGPVKNAFVQLSTLNKKGDYLSYYTSNDGQFTFSLLPFTGQQDLFISAKDASGEPIDIRIDRDFANHNGTMNTEILHLNEKERALALEMMINRQVSQAYAGMTDTVVTRVTVDSVSRCFYGQPPRTVFIDDFIALPTLEEVFFELVPEVNINKRKGVTTLVMTGHERNSADLASYFPLVLIDRVPVTNLKDLLEVAPGKIQRIELINDLYIKGSIIYGGVVSIFSKKGDLGGINLPANSFFYPVTGYYPQQPAEVKEYTDLQAGKRIPDFRNCLYWNPEIHIKPGERTSFEFYTSDNKGEYDIIVRAFTPRGKVIEKRSRFTVR